MIDIEKDRTMEIGSVLELEDWYYYRIPKEPSLFCLPFMNHQPEKYYTNFYQSGRNAIEHLLGYLVSIGRVKRVLLPDYVCQSVTDAAIRAGIPIGTYPIDLSYYFTASDIEDQLLPGDCIYIAHYFGQSLNDSQLSAIAKWKNDGFLIIEDITLSLLSADSKGGVGFGSYVLGSIRKWFSIPDGGFLTTTSEELPTEVQGTCVSKYTDYYLTVQSMKRQYIQGGCVDKALKEIYMGYYSLSIDELFSDYALYPISAWSINYLQNADIEKITAKRMENYDYLYSLISDIPGLELKITRENGYIPFGMEICCDRRDDLLKYLISEDIYCNVHWRLPASEKNSAIAQLAQRSMTIPCDQRYEQEDLRRIAKCLRKWFEEITE